MIGHADSDSFDSFRRRRQVARVRESQVGEASNLQQRAAACEVFLRIEKSDSRDNKLVEVKAHLPGHDLFAKRHASSFEAAMDEVHEALRRQVVKAHA